MSRAHMPDAGENEADDGKRFPSDLSKSTAIKKTADGFTYLDPRAVFMSTSPPTCLLSRAAFMARIAGAQRSRKFQSGHHHGCVGEANQAGCW